MVTPLELAGILLIVGFIILIASWVIGWVIRIIAIIVILVGLYYLVVAFFPGI